MTVRVVLADDQPLVRVGLRVLIADHPDLVIVGEAGTGAEAVQVVGETHPDVVVMDIRMPDMDGIETAQHIQKLDEPPAVIFTTAYDAYALKAFEVHAIDYLLKPIRLARLLEALARARSVVPLRLEVLREMKPDARSHLSVNERGRIHLIPIAEIVFLKAELKYVTVRTAEREFLLEESLARLEQEFFGRFVRVHRNCLVAKDAIRGFERAVDADGEGHWVVVLNQVAEKIDVSRRQQHIVRELGRVL
jgi:two-component system response regulator AlgR